MWPVSLFPIFTSCGLLISVLFIRLFSYVCFFPLCSRRVDVLGLVERRFYEVYGGQAGAQDDIDGRGQVQVFCVE